MGRKKKDYPDRWADKVKDITGRGKPTIYRVVKENDKGYPDIWQAIAEVKAEAKAIFDRANAEPQQQLINN